MNGREKALDSLENVKMAFARHLARQVGDTQFYSIEKARKALESDTDLQIIESALTSPSFDDAVKCVEEEIDNFVYERARESFDNYIEIEEDSMFKIVKPVLDRIRTALRERGKGK